MSNIDEGSRAQTTFVSGKARESLTSKQEGFTLLTRRIIGGSRVLSLEKDGGAPKRQSRGGEQHDGTHNDSEIVCQVWTL